MRDRLQELRDECERECAAAVGRGDRDSADAWERIGTCIDLAQESIKTDWRVIEQRRERST